MALESFNGIRSNAGERAEPGTRVCNGRSEIGQRHETRLSGGLIVSHTDSRDLAATFSAPVRDAFATAAEWDNPIT